MSRKTILILSIATLVVVAGAVGYVFLKDKFVRSEITGLEVALKVSIFLDKAFQSDGTMLSGFGCIPNDKYECKPLELDPESSANVPVSQVHLGQAIYGYYVLAKATGNQSYRTKADRAMDFVLRECQTNVTMCAWNFFPLSRYYFDTKENKYLQGMLRPAQQFLFLSDSALVGQNAGHKLASLYQATKDESYKKRLLELADAELSKMPRPTNEFGQSVQVIWSVFIPAYTVTNDKKYLTASEKFFDGFNIAENFDQLKVIDTVIRGADALLSLAEVSSNGQVYRVQAHSVLQETMNRLWDNPQNLKANGDYGFIEIQEGKYRFKKTLSNGWLVKLFVLMADEKFNLPIKQNE